MMTAVCETPGPGPQLGLAELRQITVQLNRLFIVRRVGKYQIHTIVRHLISERPKIAAVDPRLDFYLLGLRESVFSELLESQVLYRPQDRLSDRNLTFIPRLSYDTRQDVPVAVELLGVGSVIAADTLW